MSCELLASPHRQACTVLLRAAAMAGTAVAHSHLVVQLLCEDTLCRGEPGGHRVRERVSV